jgi:multidrug efflux pump subunit AcrB
MQVPGSFLPPEDASRIVLSVELPPNATARRHREDDGRSLKNVKDINGVESVFVLGGASPKGDLELRRATVTLALQKLDQSLVKKLVNDFLGRSRSSARTCPRSRFTAASARNGISRRKSSPSSVTSPTSAS